MMFRRQRAWVRHRIEQRPLLLFFLIPAFLFFLPPVAAYLLHPAVPASLTLILLYLVAAPLVLLHFAFDWSAAFRKEGTKAGQDSADTWQAVTKLFVVVIVLGTIIAVLW